MSNPLNWTYADAHKLVALARGKAREYPCDFCLDQAAHWAYDHADPEELYGLPHSRSRSPSPYSLDEYRYMPLCVACHQRFDDAVFAATK